MLAASSGYSPFSYFRLTEDKVDLYSRSAERSVGRTPSGPGCPPDPGRWCSPPTHIHTHRVSLHQCTLDQRVFLSDAAHRDWSSLLGQVTDGGRGEVEVAGLQGAQHHSVGDVAGAGGSGSRVTTWPQ